MQKEDFASLAGLTKKKGGSDYKYGNLSYQGFAEIIDTYSSVPAIDKLRFFDLLVFYFVFCNGDAHFKNFSLLEDKSGKFRLSPAYDLLNIHIHIDDGIFAMTKGLFNELKPEYLGSQPAITGKSFYYLGINIGLPEKLINSTLDKYCKIHDLTNTLINSSFLSDDLKSQYSIMYKTRINSYLCERDK